jgi:hypothetical protein
VTARAIQPKRRSNAAPSNLDFFGTQPAINTIRGITAAVEVIQYRRRYHASGFDAISGTVTLATLEKRVIWALFNLVVGYILFRVGKVASGDISVLVFFAGIVAISAMLSVRFARKQAR